LNSSIELQAQSRFATEIHNLVVIQGRRTCAKGGIGVDTNREVLRLLCSETSSTVDLLWTGGRRSTALEGVHRIIDAARRSRCLLHGALLVDAAICTLEG
jgi:hypothetical protein